jgi:hypothetical protein
LGNRRANPSRFGPGYNGGRAGVAAHINERHKRPKQSIQSADGLTGQSATPEVCNLSNEVPPVPIEAPNRNEDPDYRIRHGGDLSLALWIATTLTVQH